jgi:hypothetical protein
MPHLHSELKGVGRYLRVSIPQRPLNWEAKAISTSTARSTRFESTTGRSRAAKCLRCIAVLRARSARGSPRPSRPSKVSATKFGRCAKDTPLGRGQSPPGCDERPLGQDQHGGGPSSFAHVRTCAHKTMRDCARQKIERLDVCSYWLADCDGGQGLTCEARS